MDVKKLLKKLGFSENFSYLRKIFSSFSLGVGVSLLLITILVLNHPFKATLFQSSLTSWPFSFSSSFGSFNSSLSGEQRVQGKTQDGNLSERSNNVSSLAFGGLREKPRGGNMSEKGKNASFWDSISGESISERTHGGNVSEIGKHESFLGRDGRFSEKNSSNNNSSVNGFLAKSVEKGGNESFVGKSGGFEGIVSERNNTGNGFGNGERGRSKESVAEKPQEVKSVEIGRNGSFDGKPGGFAGMGSKRNNMGNVSGNGESERPIGGEEGVVEKAHEGNSTKEKKIGSSSKDSVVAHAAGAKCDIFDGRWVRDEGKPYYPAGSCPHIDRDFDCHLNGRPDDDFVKWRWQPNHCDIPSLNATDFLERLRGKKLIFVGDSLNRNMWESLVCVLRHSVQNKKKVYEISGRKEFKKKGFYAFRYEDYNCTVDFVSSPFLVRPSAFKTRNGTLETLRLDLMDKTTSMYHDADIIVFNTGHWWTHEKTSKGENYYQEGNHLYPRLKVMEAFTKALTTWARWIDKNIDPKRTQVFFRGYSVTHFRGGQWNSGGQCHKEVEPIFNDTFLAKYPSKMKVLEHVLDHMRTPIVYMNISKLTDYRKDAHPSIYRMEYKTPEAKIAAERSQDCSHWCLPGIPDTWNELLYASLLRIGKGSWRN